MTPSSLRFSLKSGGTERACFSVSPGRLLLNDPARSSEILFRCLLKLQYPNPRSKDFREEYGFYIAPFTAVLRLLDYLHTHGKKNGLTQEEFCYFVTTWLDIRELETQAKRILKFARLSVKQKIYYFIIVCKNFISNNYHSKILR
jgi:hypothetical protein